MSEPIEPDLIEIDGAHGEGGGQILRTSLALSAITGRPVRLFNIRAGRAKPGLQRQHLACVEAAAAITGAEVKGAALHSQGVVFRPGPLRGGSHRFAIGTAGSTGLVLQTVLPALLAAPEPSTVIVEGGTHNPLSPPFDFLDRVFVPQLRRMGAHVSLTLERHGFNPAGGGRVVCHLQPAALHPIEIVEAGPVHRTEARAILSRLPTHVGRRELDLATQQLGWPASCGSIVEVDTPGPGNALLLEIARVSDGGELTELVIGVGEKGTRAELVASRAADEMAALLASGMAVGVHLADQLLLPMALAGGGRFRTVIASPHTITNAVVISRFLDVAIDIASVDGGAEITVARR